MEYRLKVSLLPLFIILVVSAASCDRSTVSVQPTQPQNNSRAANVGFKPDPPAPVLQGIEIVIETPALQGKAAGEVLPFKLTSQDLKASVLAHPLPKVWLMFPVSENQNKQGAASTESASTVKVELPPEAKKVLLSQWKVILTATYKKEVAGLPNIESLVRQDIIIANAAEKAAQELTKVRINAPDGRRAISYDEAHDLVWFMTASSREVVNQAKKYKTESERMRKSAT